MPKQPVSRFDLSSVLAPDRILIAEPGIAKVALIERLSGSIAWKVPAIEPQQLLERIMQREAGISTTLDSGLCIPHARIEETEDIVASLSVIPGGIADSVHGGVVIKAMFLFISPTQGSSFQKHLQLLAALSSIFRPKFIEKISALSSPEDIFSEISRLH